MILIIIFVLFIIFVVFGYVSNYVLKTNIYSIPTESKELLGRTIAVLADLHGNEFGKANAKLINSVKRALPDCIFMPGDMIVKNGFGTKESISFIHQLTEICPVYCSLGNHEIRLSNRTYYVNALRQAGAIVLDNEHIGFGENQDEIGIYGLTLEQDRYSKFWNQSKMPSSQLSSMLGEKQYKMTILLAHNPQYFTQYREWGADIVVSGHMHGGIMTFPFGGVLAPSLRVFPKYTKGIYHEGESYMAVSRGLGLHHIKLRFFNFPEIMLLKFRNK